MKWMGTAAIICMILVPATLSAQNTGSAVAGVVKDTTGAVLPGVTVEASSPALIEKVRTTVTDENGQYQITDLRVGTYTVTFTLPGFAIVRREGLELSANFTASVNVELKVGDLTETVTVSGQSPVVDIHNVTQQRTISRSLLDVLPATKNVIGYVSLTPAAILPQSAMDVGGNKGELSVRASIHGTKQGDQKQLHDGMRYNTMVGTGTGRSFFPNHASIAEAVVETGSGGSAEFITGGLQVNVIPKDGGNQWSGGLFADYTGETLQGDNLTADLRARGVVVNSSINDVFEANGALGGPLKRDTLWFFTAHRRWGNHQRGANFFENTDLKAWTYTPDTSRPVNAVERYRSNNIRLTWQASEKNKITFYWDHQRHCLCNHISGSGALFAGTTAVEASPGIRHAPHELLQANWTYPASNRVLFTVGVTYYMNRVERFAQPGVDPRDISVLEQSRNFRYRAPPDTQNTGQGQSNQNFSMSYITGSHRFKTGLFILQGYAFGTITTTGNGLTYTFLNGVPSQITQFASPTFTRDVVKPELGLYAQDQWIIDRLTLTFGLRFESFRAFAAASEQAAGRFIDARSFDQVDCVPCWKDLVPRSAISYDLFGTGKTVVKASLGKYLGAQATGFASANNPVNTSVNQTSRSWNDTFYPVGDPRRNDYVPDCDLRNPQANGECGRMANTNFGGRNITTRYDPEVLNGWGSRDFNWQASAAVEHELRPGVAVGAGYFRTWYGNQLVTDNLAVTPQDFDPYCFTVPADPRLPGGGNQICGLANITPSKFGLVNNLVTFASKYGEQTEIYNGVDFNFNARLPRGALVSAGVNIGNSLSFAGNTTASTNRCFVVDSPQELYQCDKQVPYQTRFKASGTYPLPLDFQASAVFQALPGTAIAATYAVPNALIAPSLGRSLAGGASTASVELLEPYSQFEDRITQLDLRLMKRFPLGRTRIQGIFDLYNALNASPILQLRTAYGPTWLTPFEVLGARTVKLGVQMDF